jgi:hypothetical protein
MAKRAKLYYRDSRTGKFTKQGRKYARPAGVAYEGKRYEITPEDFEAKAVMKGEKQKPQVRYTSRGGFIPEKAAKHFMRSKTYKNYNELTEAQFKDEAAEAEILAEEVPFWNILQVFETDYIDIFGFKSAKIKGSDMVHEPRNLKAAKARIKAEAYKQAQKIKEANRKKDSTPDLFARIYMEGTGNYLIEFNN